MKKQMSRKDNYNRVYAAFAPVREAKKSTIHSLAGIGRKYKVLRYPLLVALAAFIFLYNLMMYALIGLKMEEKLAKVVAVFMTIVLVFTSVDLTAFAFNREDGQNDSYETITEKTVSENDAPSGEISSGDVLPAQPQDAFSQSVVENGVEISVSAPAGVFPAGVELRVRMITGEDDVSEIEQLVTEKKDAETDGDTVTVVEKSYSFDITIVDVAGNEVEPDTSHGQVSVSFKNVGVAEAKRQEDRELSVFYVSDDYTEAEELAHTADEKQDTAVITAEHFSIYTVVITSGEKKGSILHYYQGASKAASYFTIYNEEQLLCYRDLLNGYVAGTVTDNDTFSTILVNKDDSNPMEGITGEGQATNMTVKDLNFDVKIMDDITVTGEWSPLTKIPAGVTLDGAGHSISFITLATGVTFDGNSISALVKSNEGSVKHITICFDGKSYSIAGEDEEDLYATVTVRVDGQKAEIGEAITGAEALAASSDGVHYITLERDDDLAVYRTKLENLFPTDSEAPEEGMDGTYSVYYVYEDENETISAAVLTRDNHDAELNYVSVSYDLEGANTYKYVDGKLSESVMASIRVNVLADGSYEAQEDYEAVVKAAEGYAIPTREKNVVVAVDGKELTRGTDYTYTYDSQTGLGTIHINRGKITAPVSVKVKADSLEDNPPNKIVLKTKGGTVSDVLWDKSGTGTYVQDVYENTTLPATVGSYKGSDAIRFDGWYTNINCTGTPVTEHTYAEGGGTTTYYAKWVLNKQSSHKDTVYYEYYENGKLDVRGWPKDGQDQVTFMYGGFAHSYANGELSSGQVAGTAGGTSIPMVSGVGKDVFVQIPGTSVWVAMVCTLEGSLTDVTYIFENRGSSEFTSKLYFGLSADVAIAGDDRATIKMETTKNGVSYMNMTSNSNKQFRLYTDGTEFGIDKLYSYWYGEYNGGRYPNHVFSNANRTTGGDSALAFSWYINNIPAGGYVTRTTKMGLADVSVMNNITAKLEAGEGHFADGTSSKDVSSDQKSILVNADGSITVKKSSGNQTISVPSRSGWKFSHWSIGTEGGTDCAGQSGKEYTESITLYANWVPKPDKSVTNNSSVQKVNGSNNLLVPAELGNIVIHNTTPGAAVSEIYQGDTVDEAAGYASGFSCTLSMEGKDDRYLLPDDIEVTIKGENGTVTKLTKDTGYTYSVYDNRRKASLELRRQFINGDITITAVGYELPPVTATSVKVSVPNQSVQYGERAVFTASAETSKNHVANYQWYIAPYYEIKLDNKIYWTYQNQDGIPLTNGTYICPELNASQNAVTVSGANKATLRISGLDVNPFDNNTPGESMNGLQYRGYHLYCVVTSTRNITGQEIVAVSDTAELEVTTAQYAAPNGLESSATTYNGSADGEIVISEQSAGPVLLYKAKTESDWKTVTEGQIAAGAITGLAAGIYQFKYQADENHAESTVTEVTVASGRDIVVTYRAAGCDEESLRVQYKHVAYGSTVTVDTVGLDEAEQKIVEPARSGYRFAGWNPATISNITEDTTVNAVYDCGIYRIVLDSQGADTAGTEAVYEKYSDGFYADELCSQRVNGVTGITIPARNGYIFLGYFTSENGGMQMINADGRLSGNLAATRYLSDTAFYAHWKEEKTDYNPDASYDVTVTNTTGKDANVIYIYADGVLKRTLIGVEFDSKNQYTFTLVPGELGGGNITYGVGYVNPKSQDGQDKSDEEIKQEAQQQGEERTYTISYKEADGSALGTEFSGTFLTVAQRNGVKGSAVKLPTVSKTGYAFGGWYLNARGTGKAITEVPADISSDNVVVYAKWIANKYPLTLERNGGIYATGYTPADQYQHGGNNVVLPDSTQIIREDYAFLGWFDNEELLGNAITEVDATQVGGKTYYAGWEQLPAHKITLTDDEADGRKYTISGLTGYGFPREDGIYVYHGKEYRFEVEVAPAYKLKAVKANGKVLTEQNGSYSIASVSEDMIITVVTEQLVSTEEVPDAEATILLTDGTTGYFETLEEAIAYAANYGSNSVIRLQKELTDIAIDAIAGNAYSIDLNGNSILGESTMLIENGAIVKLMDSVAGTGNENNRLAVENRGEFTNEIVVPELLNLGVTINNGKIISMTQQDSESYDKSKFVNNGSIGTAKLEQGYFVENVLESAPDGLSGYHTIMNGNEYYVDFKDAVDIANASDSDATIKVLSTVDNRNEKITLSNQNGHEITVDLNGCHLSGGELVTEGKVSFVNSVGSATVVSEISAAVDNKGELRIGNFVKISGTTTNEVNGKVSTEPDSTVSGAIDNKGDFDNQGNVTGVFTNEGSVENDGTMNNVIQKDGTFKNDGDVKTKLDLQGGSYSASENAMPQIPDGAVAKSNTKPVTYYGTLADAAKDASDPGVTGAPGQKQPFVITVIDDIPDEKMGATPVVVEPQSPVDINLNNHKIGDEDTDNGLSIGGKKGTDTTVTIKNEPENGEAADEGKGKVNAPVKVDGDGSLDVDQNVSMDKVDNAGNLKTGEGSKIGELSNSGTADNQGSIGNVIQNGGTFTNGNQGGIGNLTQNGGTTENKGTIDKLTQNGGNTENTGDIKDAELNKGGYTGTTPEKINGTPSGNETDGKVAKIVPPNGEEPIYFVHLEDALEYASGMEESPVTVELLDDVTDETMDVAPGKTPAAHINLDLNGHDIKAPSSLHLEDGMDMTIKDSSSDSDKGSVTAPVVNDGTLTIDLGISVSGDVSNTGNMINQGEISGKVENKGTFDNQGKVTGNVEQKNGTYINEDGASTGKITQTGGETVNRDDSGVTPGGISEIDLRKGSYEGDAPAAGVEGEARIGDKIYGDLESAIEDANKSDTEVKIELTKDVMLPDSPALVIDNENGKDITIDMNGNDISGGTIRVGDNAGSSTVPAGKVKFEDSTNPTGGDAQGTISSNLEVKQGGNLTLGEGVTASGDVNNAGKMDNEGEITPGTVTNTGDMTNNGHIGGTVKQEGGTLTNGENGQINSVEQTGGALKNENTGSGIGMAQISGGEYKGEPAQDMDYNGATVAVIKQNPDGTTQTVYYPTLEDALKNTDGDATLKLLEDIKDDKGENIVIDKPGITIDLNGHQIDAPSDVTVTENGKNTKLEDSSDAKTGQITVPVTNHGELTVGGDVTVKEIENTGKLDNRGNLDKLTNKGEAVNSGTIGAVKQESGNIENKDQIGTIDFAGGSYQGKEPDSAQDIENAVAKIGDKRYADLEDAIRDANRSEEDARIEIIKDTSLPDTTESATEGVGNENGKNITIDLGGNTVTGGPLKVKAPGSTEITNSDKNGKGSLQTDVKVDSGASLTIDKNTEVQGDVENKGTTNNNGTIAGDVDNAGNMKNEGIISGEVDNTGDLSNRGNIDNNVLNHESGKLDNDGNLNGQLENKDNATTENSGKINQVKQSGGEVTNNNGGSINEYRETDGSLKNENGGLVGNLIQTGGKSDNEGTIEGATLSDMKDYTGKLPESGLPEVGASLTYTDKNGKTTTEHYTNFEEALEAAKQKKPSTLTIVKSPVTVTDTVTIPEGITVDIPEDKELVVEPGGKLDNYGKIQAEGTFSNEGILSNKGQVDGKLDNTGALDNSGAIQNVTNRENGSFDNTGSVTGTLENKDSATTNNAGTIDRLEQTGGKTNNEGTVDRADVTDLSGYTGKLPETGLPGAGASVTYIDENGRPKTEHYHDLKDALDAAKEKIPSMVTVVKSPVTVTEPVTVPKGVDLEIPENKELVIGNGGALDNQGNVQIQGNGSLTVKQGGTLSNSGKLGNAGVLNNAGKVLNNGTFKNESSGNITNTGDISIKAPGSMTNKGAIDNKRGSLNAAEGADGMLVNDGSISGGTINGPLENTSKGSITDSDKLSGNIKNNGAINVKKDADVSGAQIENGPSGSYVKGDKNNGNQGSGNQGSGNQNSGNTGSGSAPSDTESVTSGQENNGMTDRRPGGNRGTSGRNNTVERNNTAGWDEAENEEEQIPQKEEILQRIQQAMAEGTLALDGATVLGEENLTEKERAELIDSVLTSAEKKEVLAGASVRIRAEVDVVTDEEISDEYRKILEDMIPDYENASLLNVQLFKQINSGKEQRIPGKVTVQVSFELPEEYRTVAGEQSSYRILRIVTDENGQSGLEETEYTVTDNVVTMYVDTESEYIIITGAGAGISQNATAQGQNSGSLTQAQKSVSWYWIPIVILILLLLILIIKKEKERRDDKRSNDI